jgi:opacity protein-like surface antigen
MKEETMKKILWILAALGACLVAAAALAADQAAEKAGEEGARKAAREAAKSWIAVVDSGKYAESWTQASSYFRKQVSAEQWENAVRSARGPLGRLLARDFKSAEYSRTLPGAPDGEYVVIQYDGSFENKKEALETVVAMKEKDGDWRVGGYFIK